MAGKTEIQWTDMTLNPVTGCDRVSSGCTNCYALTLAKRLKAMGNVRYQNDGDLKTSGPGFGVSMHPDVLEKPFHWRNPQRVFVNSMSDLWHAEVTTEFIAECFAVFALTPQHTYQILTKRPQRMKRLLNDPGFWDTVAIAAERRRRGADRWHPRVYLAPDGPLPNVWLGVSVENQDYAWRIDWLAKTPAAVRFLSIEPMIGPVDLDKWLWRFIGMGDGDYGPLPMVEKRNDIHWVIAGGESGKDYRPMDPAWARSLRYQCAEADVPFFFKQWGGRTPKAGGRLLDGQEWNQFPTVQGAHQS